MDDKRKKQLIWEYKNRKPDMGILSIRCIPENKSFLGVVIDSKAQINSNRMKLESNWHPNKELQQLWNIHGAEHFTIEMLEELSYDKKEEKQDYTEELEELLEQCIEATAGASRLYKKRK